jgi:hypothetical protein
LTLQEFSFERSEAAAKQLRSCVGGDFEGFFCVGTLAKKIHFDSSNI